MAEEQQRRGAFRTSIGGQALIEGILMRGPEKQAIVVRDKDGKLEEKKAILKLIEGPLPHFRSAAGAGHCEFSGGDGQRREGPDVFRRFLPGRGGRAALQI